METSFKLLAAAVWGTIAGLYLAAAFAMGFAFGWLLMRLGNAAVDAARALEAAPCW